VNPDNTCGGIAPECGEIVARNRELWRRCPISMQQLGMVVLCGGAMP
jgi:hypothetical protein